MLSGSSSILSGALDNFGDALTYVLSLAVVGASIAAKARVAFFKGFLILGANLVCLRLLTPYRDGDVNLSSAWECSRNDVSEGVAVIAAALFVWLFESMWPDVLIAAALVVLFLRSAIRVLQSAWLELHPDRRGGRPTS